MSTQAIADAILELAKAVREHNETDREGWSVAKEKHRLEIRGLEARLPGIEATEKLNAPLFELLLKQITPEIVAAQARKYWSSSVDYDEREAIVKMVTRLKAKEEAAK